MHSRPVDTRSTTPHSQIAAASRPVRRASQRARLARVALQELERVFAHEDAHVVLGLGEQAVRVDQPEAVGGLQHVPLVHVAMDQDGPFIVMGIDAQRGARQRMV